MGCGKVNQEMRSIKIFSASASSRETGFNMRRLGDRYAIGPASASTFHGSGRKCNVAALINRRRERVRAGGPSSKTAVFVHGGQSARKPFQYLPACFTTVDTANNYRVLNYVTSPGENKGVLHTVPIFMAGILWPTPSSIGCPRCKGIPPVVASSL